MSNPILALIPSGQKATKVYSVLPSDGSGDFTFARTGTATRVREDGLIETVATTVPRLDWLNSNCPNLLLEPSATQLAAFNTNIKSANSSFDSPIALSLSERPTICFSVGWDLGRRTTPGAC